MPNLAYATTGPGLLYNAIGWFNFASAPATVVSPTTLTLTNDIKGGGTLQATFTFSRNTSGSANFVKTVPPTWSGAAFGNTAYRGITQPVCMRDLTDTVPNYGKIDVSNIILKNKYGELITNYNFYFTDSETPAAGDQEQFITNGSPWTVFYTLPNSGQGFATLTGVGTQTVSAAGLGNTPILLTTNPTGISQTLTGGGAMSFGMSLTTAELVKIVNNRIDPNDQFKLDVTGPNSGTTITIGQQTGVQPQGLQLISGEGGQSVFTFNESMAPGSVSSLSLYNPVVQVSNLTAGGTTLPSTINLGSSLTLNIGDYALVTIINSPAATSVTLNKAVDKPYASVGDILTYTVVVRNPSSYPIRNVVLSDTIPNFTTFVSNSMTVDGSSVSGTPAPPTGVSLGTIPAGSASTITFKVLVQSTIPSPNRVSNNSTVIFAPTISIGSVTSQTVLTTINSAVITSSKSVDKSNAFTGSTLTYTLVYRNSGNTTANNLIVIDTIPNDTTFVNNSIKLNNVTQTGATISPPNGFTIGSLGVNSTATVQFQVTVDTIPTINPIPNNASASFNFIPNTITGTTVAGSTNTNTVSTYINPDNNPLKIVDKQYASVGDTLTYTVIYTEEYGQDELNAILIDTIPNNTSFVTGSVNVNGITLPSSTVASPGLSLGTLPANGVTTVTFKVTITTIPSPNPIPNIANMTFDFVTNTISGAKERRSALSNTVTTKVNLASLSNTSKTVDKLFATVGDVLTYTVTFSSSGNTTSNNVIFRDTIPNDTTFVTDSVYINGVQQSGLTVAPPNGLSIGSIAPNTITTVSFKVTVNTIPSPNPIPNRASISGSYTLDEVTGTSLPIGTNSNLVNTTINYSSINSSKIVNKTYANVGDILTYTIPLTNVGNTTANNVIFSDTIPSDTTLVPGSFTQNGVSISGSPSPPGVLLNNISAGSTLTVVFKVTVNTIPSPNPINNSATTTFNYTIDTTTSPTRVGNNSSNTNTVSTQVNNASLSNISKSVDKSYATCGDIVTYTIVLPNTGNIAATNVVLKDTIPSGSTFVSNSVYVNNVQQSGANPQTGISVGTINAGSTTTVRFSVVINC